MDAIREEVLEVAGQLAAAAAVLAAGYVLAVALFSL